MDFHRRFRGFSVDPQTETIIAWEYSHHKKVSSHLLNLFIHFRVKWRNGRQDRVHPWRSGQLITMHYVGICGFGTFVQVNESALVQNQFCIGSWVHICTRQKAGIQPGRVITGPKHTIQTYTHAWGQCGEMFLDCGRWPHQVKTWKHHLERAKMDSEPSCYETTDCHLPTMSPWIFQTELNQPRVEKCDTALNNWLNYFTQHHPC